MSENKPTHTMVNSTDEDRMKFFEAYDNKLQEDSRYTGINLINEDEKAKYPENELIP